MCPESDKGIPRDAIAEYAMRVIASAPRIPDDARDQIALVLRPVAPVASVQPSAA